MTWIKCSDRMPKDGVNVLVPVRVTPVRYAVMSYSSLMDLWQAQDSFSCEAGFLVSHWMPLPALPKDMQDLDPDDMSAEEIIAWTDKAGGKFADPADKPV